MEAMYVVYDAGPTHKGGLSKTEITETVRLVLNIQSDFVSDGGKGCQQFSSSKKLAKAYQSKFWTGFSSQVHHMDSSPLGHLPTGSQAGRTVSVSTYDKPP
jgi:hypothetical protein